MKILIVTQLANYSPSGVVTYYQALANDLRQRGHEVTIVETIDTPYVWNKLLNVFGHIMNRLGRTSRVCWAEFGYFVRLYLGTWVRRKTGFDIIHAQDPRSGVAAYLALGKKVPVVLTCHFNDDPVSEIVIATPIPARFEQWLTQWYVYLFSFIKNYVFVSNYTYTKSKHLLPNTIHKEIVYNTVTIDSHVSATPTASLGCEQTKSLIISNVGYVDERKNQRLLILVGHELKQRGFTDFSIWLIGDGPKRTEYKQLAAELGLSQQVIFHGRQPAPWRLVAQTDLYVHTALNDNCPYSILEAFAVQTPVLALPVGGIPELLPDNQGILQGNETKEMANQIARYFDVAERNRLCAIQTAYAGIHFNRDLALNRLVDFYHKVKRSKQALVPVA